MFSMNLISESESLHSAGNGLTKYSIKDVFTMFESQFCLTSRRLKLNIFIILLVLSSATQFHPYDKQADNVIYYLLFRDLSIRKLQNKG